MEALDLVLLLGSALCASYLEFHQHPFPVITITMSIIVFSEFREF